MELSVFMQGSVGPVGAFMGFDCKGTFFQDNAGWSPLPFRNVILAHVNTAIVQKILYSMIVLLSKIGWRNEEVYWGFVSHG